MIGDIDLVINQQILYLFDFGDGWHFDVTLEKIQTDVPLLPSPEILERKGKAPKQYGRYYE